ncbi:hypothetical protein DAPPUDRAFT_315962 [Daphnia pulex]|uniref:Uncharacterized protein n=1 Tax=Daphnia pulex TaxID=6669 RepID=E9GC55_DAPPU|nr:hypothetical protein DAPPUDRAFT_315962 [Daphnia pulex]|eukprot:EFX83199.1 hypothetical protein DAPPUDRAFT_315962 [Daphnia pulex]
MKFAVYLVAESSVRLGSLTEFARIPEAVFEIPLLLLHTRGASAPHLSYDLLQMHGFNWAPHASDASGYAC